VKLRGIAEGNAQISGVASVDAFFGSVLRFQSSAESVASGIDAQLAAIRADFGLAADADVVGELQNQFSANLSAGVRIVHEPPHCSADVKATLDAQARCDASVDPGKAMLACKGECELSANAAASCDANADLECTVSAPAVSCEGECHGSCQVDLSAAAACDGTCRGSCSGTCNAYVMGSSGQAQCAGRCDGMCTGSCELQLSAGASCTGKCSGECVVMNPSAGCNGALHARCKARAGAMVMCQGRCEGDFEPPKAKAECQASAKANAKCNLQCTPPRVDVKYEFASSVSLAAAERARFAAALDTLARVRMPALLAESERGTQVVQAGTELVGAARGAVKGSLDEALSGKLSVQEAFGLGCAVGQLPDVDSIVNTANQRLSTSLDAATALTTMLGG
jgi:hypothetical protein